MTRFMKVSVPEEGYVEISRIGNLYVVHLDGVQKDDMIECYEYITEDTPDVSQLQEDLVVWKNYIAEKELQFAKEVKCKEGMSLFFSMQQITPLAFARSK